jgi:hypothetical protein
MASTTCADHCARSFDECTFAKTAASQPLLAISAIDSLDLARVNGFAVRKISRAIREEAAYVSTLSRKHFLKRDAVFF